MGYCIQDIVSRYQKKIGTYDKQQWEKTVEERILYGFTHVPKKKAKLKTELIDVDLVRGSSFTKAKPKHGLLTVTRQALLRLIFLPAYARWWSQQTSPRLCGLLLTLYVLQIGNMFLFSYASHNLPEDVIENVSGSEVVVPAAMMLFLCILHSEIVSPRTGSKDLRSFTSKSRRYKRAKRRSRVSCDCKSSSPDAEKCVQESSGKFPKRVRLRMTSYEEGSIRRKRNVIWDTSPTKSRLTPGREHSSCPDAVEDLGTRFGMEDDGFESLNSSLNGSGEDVQGDDESQSVTKEQEEEEDDEEEDTKMAELAQWSKRANWIQSSNRRLSNRGIVSSAESHDDSSSESSIKNTICEVAGGEERVMKRQEGDEPASGGSLLNRRRGSETALTLPKSVRGASGRLDGGRTGGSSGPSTEDDEDRSPGPASGLTEGTTSAAEWICFTTNSEDCSVSSDIDNDSPPLDHPFASEFQLSPPIIPSPSCAASDKVSCTVWEKGEVKKALMSVLDISSAIIGRVERMPDNLDYFYGGMLVSVLLALVPSLCRLIKVSPTLMDPASLLLHTPVQPVPFINFLNNGFYYYIMPVFDSAFGTSPWERCITVISVFERLVLSGFLFFLVAVAERTFKQRFLYAKFFSHLTSFRRARKSELPHFRLNKVRNIKTWLSVRSYLKKRGPQHSVDVIVSSILLITLLLLSFLSVELLKDSERLHCVYNIEALAWCIILGLFLLRFMTLGTKINRKNRNLSVLITEQINLYLQIEQKPNKKDELNVANAVLKLAADLLKELECPYKISGLANPYLYTVTKVVILSALSGVLSEMLGFKLKLDKIKIK